jgi:hypothetical protein
LSLFPIYSCIIPGGPFFFCFDAAFTCCPIGEIPSPVQCALRDARDVVEVLTRLRDRGTGYCTPWPSPVAGRRAAMPYCTSPRGTITIKVWTGVTTGRDRNVGGENLIVDGHTGISVEYGHHCTTSEHVTTLSRPYQSQYDRYLIRTELEIEVVPGPLLLLLDVNRSPARRLWCSHVRPPRILLWS